MKASARLVRRLSLTVLLVSAWLAGCTPPERNTLPGVVEAEIVHVAAPAAGRLVELNVTRGATVNAGAALFRIESPDDIALLAEAQARVAQQSAQQADLAKGKRPDEMAVTEAQLAQARTAWAESEAQLKRERELAQQGFVSGNRLDTLNAQRDEAAAKVRELEAQTRVAALAGRVDTRRAAQASLQAAQAQARQLSLRLSDKTVAAPIAGMVDDTLFRAGEWVGAGTPVVNLLPPSALKVRFFVAQHLLPRLKVGEAVSVSCDGCGAAVPARIGYVANSAEYTPPVIYSREQRAKLVYLVEAWPDATGAARLRVGQPVDVALMLPPP